jgi:hypothetical protein
MPVNIDQVDPQGPDGDGYYVIRGCSCHYYAEYGRSARRDGDRPKRRVCGTLGFRIVLELSEEEFLRYAKQRRPY